jgi:acetyltransferase-like isoleucine patch superfamily enzyme
MINPVEKTKWMVGKSQVEVGAFTYGANLLSIMEWGEGASLRIGKFCSIANNIKIFLGGNHRVDWISTFPFGHINLGEFGGSDIIGHPSTNGDVIVGNDVWIGHGTTILSGIEIGNGAVLAANSNITKNVPPYSIVGGNPGKILKMRFNQSTIDDMNYIRWWDFPIEDIRDIASHLCSCPSVDALVKMKKKRELLNELGT